jgi:hypothetical protein
VTRRWGAVVALVTALLAGPARLNAGQFDDERTSEGGMRLGQVRFRPMLTFNSGIDTNIFNTVDQPASDVISTLSPKTDVWMRMGPARVSGRGGIDVVYFQNTPSERTLNAEGTMKISVPMNHLEPYVSSSYLKTRERPTIEIDARSLRHEQSVSMGTTVRLSGRSSVVLDATKSEVRFDSGAVFLQTSLGDVLNRDDTSVRASLRHRLTPLTTLTIGAELMDERFVQSPIRNSRSLRIAPELDFGATALITGRLSVGYRTFSPQDPSIPDFNGLVASVDLAYTLLGATRFAFQARRDVDYSYQFFAPYYVDSGMSGEITQRVSDSLGISARYGFRRLDYRSLVVDGVEADPTVDSIVFYGAGVIRKIGRDLRVKVTADYNQRRSLLQFREYHSVRGGVSVVYGFKS